MSNGISLSAKRRINNLGNFFLASQWIDPLAVARDIEAERRMSDLRQRIKCFFALRNNREALFCQNFRENGNVP